MPPVIASLIDCVELSFAILTTTITHLKRRLNLIQIEECFSVRRGSVQRASSDLNLVKDDFVEFWVRPAQTSVWWDNVRAGLAIVLDIPTTLKKAAKSHRWLGLRMPTIY